MFLPRRGKLKTGVFLVALLVAIFLAFQTEAKVSNDSLYILLSDKGLLEADTLAVDKMNNIARVYHYDLEYSDSSKYWAEKALALSEKLKYKSGIADSYYIRALYFLRLENEELVTNYLTKALENYSGQNSLRSIQGISRVYMQQSILNYKLKHFKEAARCIDQAILILTKYNQVPSTTFIYLKGVYLSEDGQYASALPLLEQTLVLRLKEKDPLKIMEARIYAAVAYGKLGQNEKALELFSLAKDWAMKSGDSDAITTTLMKEGQFYLDIKNYEKAEEDLLVALRVTQHRDKKLMVLETLGRIYSETKRYQEAFNQLDQYINIKKTDNIDALSREIATLRIKSDLVKQESEIQLLEQKNRNDQLLTIALTIVCILILITAIVAYKRFTFKRDANRKLSQANQELMQTLEDLQLAEQQLLQAEKMASLGRVTAGIAHELRNPLNFIHNFAAVASDTVDDYLKADSDNKVVLAEDLRTSIEKIKFHGNKAEQIITTMLRHGREKALDVQDVSLQELIDESVAIATKNFSFKHEGFQCKIDQHHETDDVRIRVNPKSIPLVLGNLIDNAMYSVMQKDKLSGNGYSPAISLHHELNEKGLLLEIEDNGVGLPLNDGNEIFEPFYTTKPTGHGTGLGLSICYEILKAHGASISVQNNSKGGATFSIVFPTNLIINSN